MPSSPIRSREALASVVAKAPVAAALSGVEAWNIQEPTAPVVMGKTTNRVHP
jgi:hypothetical protein